MSGRQCRGEGLRLAGIHWGSSGWEFWGLEHVNVLGAFGCSVHLLLKSSVTGGPWAAVVQRNCPVCQLQPRLKNKIYNKVNMSQASYIYIRNKTVNEVYTWQLIYQYSKMWDIRMNLIKLYFHAQDCLIGDIFFFLPLQTKLSSSTMSSSDFWILLFQTSWHIYPNMFTITCSHVDILIPKCVCMLTNWDQQSRIFFFWRIFGCQHWNSVVIM